MSELGKLTPLEMIQQLLETIITHDVDTARALFTPEAQLVSVQADGAATVLPCSKWLERMAENKDKWLERIWNPQVLEHGSIAVVWAEYDFYRNGEFGHCGVNSFQLLKTAAGWKIANVADTRKTVNCSPSPLGPPPK